MKSELCIVSSEQSVNDWLVGPAAGLWPDAAPLGGAAHPAARSRRSWCWRWWKRIYPHTPLVVALAVPCVLSLALLVEPRLLPVIAIIDVVIPLVALVDLFTLPRKKAFAIERETTRDRLAAEEPPRHAARQQPQPPAADRPGFATTSRRNSSPTPKEFVLRLAARSRTTVHYELKASRRGAFSAPADQPARPQPARPVAAVPRLSAGHASSTSIPT